MPTVTTPWVNDSLDRLATVRCGYHADSSAEPEPMTLAALALLGAGRIADARRQIEWLAQAQSSQGSIAPFAEITASAWPTPIAILAAAIADQPEFFPDDKKQVSNFNLTQASQWLLTAAGTTIENSPQFGHDGLLVGWPWVLGTHSWQEPTAWSVLALKALGLHDHPRTREGVELLINRLLEGGGCNYGNTYVLGQKLRPQVEPTGIAMLALAGETNFDRRIELSLQYIADSLSRETTPNSLSYGLVGLTAHRRRPAEADEWLESAHQRTTNRDASPRTLAVLVLAAQAENCPLIKFTAAPKHSEAKN